jgi:hypothetical protein
MRFPLALLTVCLTATSVTAQQVSTIHLDLDDCDDIATDARSLYLACHATHPPGVSLATPPNMVPNMDGYAAKIDRRSGKLLYLVRLGGERLDIADRVIVDRRGFAYLTGFTGSLDFPITPNALQKTYGGGDSDSFLAVIDPNGNITYSTYFGGAQADQGDAIAWARNGEVLIAGTSWSLNLPYVEASFGPRGNGDAFVASLKPNDASKRRGETNRPRERSWQNLLHRLHGVVRLSNKQQPAAEVARRFRRIPGGHDGPAPIDSLQHISRRCKRRFQLGRNSRSAGEPDHRWHYRFR